MIWKSLIKPVSDVINKTLDKIAGDKMSGAEKAQFKLEAQAMVIENLQHEEDNFREFVIEYEGAAKDLPTSIQKLRGSVRPVLTYYLILLFSLGQGYVFFHHSLEPDKLEYLNELMEMVFKLNILSLGFWYGEKLLTRSGLAKTVQGIFGKKKEK